MYTPGQENKTQKNIINAKNLIPKPPDKNSNNYRPTNIQPPKEEYIPTKMQNTSLKNKKENDSQDITKNISTFLQYLLNSDIKNDNNNNNKKDDNNSKNDDNTNNDNSICPINASTQKNFSFSFSQNDNICNQSSELSEEMPENKNDNCILNNISNYSNNDDLNMNEKNKKEETNINENVPNKDKDDNAIYLVDSEDDREETKKLNNSNNHILENNINNKPNIENNHQNNQNNQINNDIKNNNPMNETEINNQKKEITHNSLFGDSNNTQNKSLLPNLNINNINNNLNDKNNINNINNIQSINNGSNRTINESANAQCENKKLFYRRKLKGTKRKYKGKEKVNVQFFISEYKSNELFPTFIFDNKQFFYTPRNYRQKTQNSKGYYISFPNLIKLYGEKLIEKDLETMCTYYFRQKRGKQSRLDIKVKDEKTLNDGVFLNDGIVNFYLKIIEDEYTFGEGKTNQILIQKSFFYNSLAFQNSDLSNNDFCYPESCSFIKTKINVFSFKTLIIPICEHYHWSLIIVNDIDKMKNIFSEENLKDYKNEILNNNINLKEDEYDYPEIFYLDSLYHINDRRTLIILKFLFYEYQKIYSIKCNMELFFLNNYNKIERCNPNVPKQNNNYDCGIFILMYAELFLYNPDYFLKYASKKLKKIKENELDKSVNTNNKTTNDNKNNKISNISNNYIINNNIINNINIAPNTNNNILDGLINIHNNNDNIVYNVGSSNNISNENINSDNIIRNNMNYLNMNGNQMADNNNQIKNEDMIKLNNNKENMKNINQDNINSNFSDMGNKTELSQDNMDIEIEFTNNNIRDNENLNLEEYNNQDKEINNEEKYNEQNENQEMPLNEEIKPEEESLKNWFSLDLINNQRNKIKNLIKKLSDMEKEIDNKNNIERIIKEQDIIIKKYMEQQKKEFDEYFLKKELKNNN